MSGDALANKLLANELLANLRESIARNDALLARHRDGNDPTKLATSFEREALRSRLQHWRARWT